MFKSWFLYAGGTSIEVRFTKTWFNERSGFGLTDQSKESTNFWQFSIPDGRVTIFLEITNNFYR